MNSFLAKSIRYLFVVVTLISTLASITPVVDHTIVKAAASSTICDFVQDNDKLFNDCKQCVITEKKSWTAIGCIDTTSPASFTSSLINLGIAIGGGIAFLLMLFGGFQVMTSAGNPDQLEAGKELVSAALAGLLMIIFSVFLLRIIGVDILGLPGFS